MISDIMSLIQFFFVILSCFCIAKSITHRKEIRNMTQEEFGDYMDAIWVYKNEGRQDGRDYMVTYDEAVAQHAMAALNTTVDQAHVYAAFSIWHSIMVREFEIALQSINPNISVPYWDWTVGDDSDADPYNSVIFSDDYFGESAGIDRNYVVNNSRMAYFPINDDPMNISGVWWESPMGFLRGPSNWNPSPYVTRHKTAHNSLPTSADFEECLYQQNYSTFWACTWGTPGTYTQSEVHAGVHEWAGGAWYNDTLGKFVIGDVLDFDTSPNDPLWWSHHAQLDRLHYYWMQYIGESLATGDDPCGGYYGGLTTYPQPAGHNLWDHFSPPFYAYRTNEEIDTLGPMNISEACYWLSPTRCNYTYDAYSNLEYDDYYGMYADDDAGRLPTLQPTQPPTDTHSPSTTQQPTEEQPTNEPTEAPTKDPDHPTWSPTIVRTRGPTAAPESVSVSVKHKRHAAKAPVGDSVTSSASTVSGFQTSSGSSSGSDTSSSDDSNKWRVTLISAGVGASLGLVAAVVTLAVHRYRGNLPVTGPSSRLGGIEAAYDALPSDDVE